MGFPMSETRLQEALARLDEVIDGDEELQQWRQDPVDQDIVEEIVDGIAPLRLPTEALWMAENGGYLPGFSGWGRWEGLSVPSTIELPTPDRDTSWFQYGNQPDDLEAMVIPISPERWETAPVGFTDRYLFFEVRFPSLATMLESFSLYLERVGGADPAIGTEVKTIGWGFADIWFTRIHEADPDAAADDGGLGRVLADCQAPIKALFETADRSHPTWTEPMTDRMRSPRADSYDDGWIPPDLDDDYIEGDF